MNARAVWRAAITTVVALMLIAPDLLGAQTPATPLVPYFGKNQIRYTNFNWHIYTTEHFEIYYYPEIEEHLERVAGYTESAYQHISSELKHDLSAKVPLILFKTSSEFQQQNVVPGAAQEGVGAFAEPSRDRIVMPLDDPPDLLYRLIVHELTHVFQFDIVPPQLIRRSVPLWVNEGHADYMTGVWRPIDLMTVRDAAISDIVPKMSHLEGYGQFTNPRLIYNLGHAVFDFIESRWEKGGVRDYFFALRKSVVGGGEDAFAEAFKLSDDEFDEQFEKYLKDRFKPFRDKERPANYGKNLAPNPEKTKFTNALSVEPSPSGDLLAVMTGNRSDREYDIVLLSARDGSVIRNLTKGFDKDKGFEFITLPGGRWNTVPWISWAPSGDRLAYFVRHEKSRTLVLQNVVDGRIERRIEMRTVDDPESPDFSPDGRKVAFAALQHGVGDIFIVDLETMQITNVTSDAFADAGPTWSPDGSSLVYVARVSGSEKLFRVDLSTGQKTQLTFGTHDDGAAQFLDDHTLVFTSTATDPAQPVAADVARNGNIYNIWTLDLRTGELRQYTDTVGGNTSPVVLNTDRENPRIAFIGYEKGEYHLHTIGRKTPVVTAASADFGSPGPTIDFQAPISHTLIAANMRRKKTFEKLLPEARPPVNVGITSSGTVFGGSQATFTDAVGDKQINLYVASVSLYRTLSLGYVDLQRRFQYALQGYSQTQFFYGPLGGALYSPSYGGFVDPRSAVATRTVQGGSAFGIWPLNRYRRVEVFGGVQRYREQYADPDVQQTSLDYQQQQFGRVLFRTGTMVPFGVSYVQETTVFREFGPLAGNTMRLTYGAAPRIGNTLSRQTADLDARYYQRLGGSGLLALRGRGFKSWGQYPDFTYFGGNSEMRGYEYLQFIGQDAFFLNAELRFPLIDAMLTPLGIVGGFRGVLFADMGGSRFVGQPFRLWARKSEIVRPITSYALAADGSATPIEGPPTVVSGLRLVDGRASYGLGLETFMLGFPVHFDWAWRTLLNKEWEDVAFFAQGGSAAFRKPRFAVWIGYDF